MSGAQYPIPPFVESPPMAMPLAIPVGADVWEASVRLLTTSTETARVPCKLRAPAKIVQMRPSVVLVGDPLQVSTELAEQLWVQIDVDTRTLLTVSTTTDTNAPTTGNFVTLASYKDRLLNVWAGSPTPEFGFVFKSKHGPPGSGFARDLILSMTLVGYYVDDNGNPILRKLAA